MNSPAKPTVAVVDDDASVRKALTRLMRLAGYDVLSFDCGQAFLQHPGLGDIACVLLDLRLPDLSGLEVQAELAALQQAPPIVFMTGHGDIPTAVYAVRRGAVDFLIKPCTTQEIQAAVARALQRDAVQREARERQAVDCARLASLTPREREVLERVAMGLRSKQIAVEFGIAEKTVKIHRSHIMEKTGLHTIADLVRFFERCRVTAAAPPQAERPDEAGLD